MNAVDSLVNSWVSHVGDVWGTDVMGSRGGE